MRQTKQSRNAAEEGRLLKSRNGRDSDQMLDMYNLMENLARGRCFILKLTLRMLSRGAFGRQSRMVRFAGHASRFHPSQCTSTPDCPEWAWRWNSISRFKGSISNTKVNPSRSAIRERKMLCGTTA